jgi:hypothetical protein
MASDIMNGSTGSHKTALAILLEAAQRVADKEHSRDDVTAGAWNFNFTITGEVGFAGNPGTRELTASYAGTLNVGEDEDKTPTTPYKEVAAFLLSKMNEATRAVCLTAVAAGEFAADNSTVALFDAACKQWREAEKARNPERKRGSVKPTYHSVDVTAEAAIQPTPAKKRKAG